MATRTTVNLGHKIVTVDRKNSTTHFLKYNQRPHHYFTMGTKPF